MAPSSQQAKTAALALAPIISAALVGASFQLIFYPQVVFGLFLLVLGTAMKLYNAWLGIFILLVLLAVSVALVVLLHTRLQRGLPHAVTKLAVKLGPKAFDLVKSIPPSLIVTAAFALPALGQLNASFSMVRMLVKVGAESSLATISLFSLASLALTLAVQVFGVVNGGRYLTPGKISFLLNSAWIVKSVVVDGNTRPGGKSLFPFVTTMILGWSSLILSSLPDRAVLNASQAAMKAAMVSAAVASGGVAVAAAVNHRSNNNATGGAGGAVEEIVELMTNEDEVTGDEEEDSSSRYADFLLALQTWLAEQVERLKQNPKFAAQFAKLHAKLDEAKGKLTDSTVRMQGAVLEQSDTVFAQLNEQLLAEEKEEVPGDELTVDDTTPTPTTSPSVAFLQAINPPVPVAVAVSVLRAVPTLIVFLLVELLGLFHVVVRKDPVKEVVFPVILLPFVVAELFALAKRVGMKRGLKQAYRMGVSGLANSNQTDGMSVLLWQSPKLLAIWNQFKLADSRIGDISHAIFSSGGAPTAASIKDLLFPSEEYIGSAPAPDASVWIKLLGSFIIDLIGVSTFAIPGLGETFDVMWAPVSGLVIQQVYGSPGFAFMGFAEEILPFTDVVPTATIAWFWLFAAEIPVWVIRVVRFAKEKQQEQRDKKKSKQQ